MEIALIITFIVMTALAIFLGSLFVKGFSRVNNSKDKEYTPTVRGKIIKNKKGKLVIVAVDGDYEGKEYELLPDDYEEAPPGEFVEFKLDSCDEVESFTVITHQGRDIPKASEKWLHFKGNHYEIIGIADADALDYRGVEPYMKVMNTDNDQTTNVYKDEYGLLINVSKPKSPRYVIYTSVEDSTKVYARAMSEFMSEVDKVKYPSVTQKYRFEKLR